MPKANAEAKPRAVKSATMRNLAQAALWLDADFLTTVGLSGLRQPRRLLQTEWHIQPWRVFRLDLTLQSQRFELLQEQ